MRLNSPDLRKTHKFHFESDFFMCGRGGLCKWSNVNVKIVQRHLDEDMKINLPYVWKRQNYKIYQQQQINCCTFYIFFYYYFAATCFDGIAIFRKLLWSCCIAFSLNNIGVSYLKLAIAPKHVAKKNIKRGYNLYRIDKLYEPEKLVI
jgi:hypothetical protein